LLFREASSSEDIDDDRAVTGPDRCVELCEKSEMVQALVDGHAGDRRFVTHPLGDRAAGQRSGKSIKLSRPVNRAFR